METIHKFFKWSASFIRICYLKLVYGSALKLVGGGKIYVGKGVKVTLEKDAVLQLSKGVSLSDFVHIHVARGASVEIGEDTFFNEYCRVVARKKICIGEHCLFGANVSVYDHDHDVSEGVAEGLIKFKCRPVQIGEGVWCCTNVVILAGATVQRNNVIGAGAVVPGLTLRTGGVWLGVPVKRKKELHDT